MTLSQVIADGQALVSSAGTFELGFFGHDPSSNRRFKNITTKQTVVWVANRDSPLTDATGALNLTTDGNLILCSHHNLRPGTREHQQI